MELRSSLPKANHECKEGKQREKSNMKKFKRIATLGHISSTFWAPFHSYYILFRSSGSQESNTSNGVRIEAEMKKLWPSEDNRTKLSENFAAAKSACETTCRHTCATSQVQIPFSQLWIKLRNHLQVVKSPPSCEITNLTCEMDNFNLWNFHKLHLNLRNPPV